MLVITIEANELYNEETQEFVSVKEKTLQLEHSLVAVAKWEAKFGVPFLTEKPKENAEIMEYIFFMIKTPGVKSDVLLELSQKNFEEINAYINSNQTATTFGEMPSRRGQGEVITAELIYYWMVAFNIPWDCQKWHINRLFALIRICNIKQEKPKKMTRSEIAQRNAKLNAERKAQYNTNG